MENALEQEQEFIVNRMQKQLEMTAPVQVSTPSSPLLYVKKRHLYTKFLQDPIDIATISHDFFFIFYYFILFQFFQTSQSKWMASHSPTASISEFMGPSAGLMESLKAEVNALRLKITELEKECKVVAPTLSIDGLSCLGSSFTSLPTRFQYLCMQ